MHAIYDLSVLLLFYKMNANIEYYHWLIGFLLPNVIHLLSSVRLEVDNCKRKDTLKKGIFVAIRYRKCLMEAICIPVSASLVSFITEPEATSSFVSLQLTAQFTFYAFITRHRTTRAFILHSNTLTLGTCHIAPLQVGTECSSHLYLNSFTMVKGEAKTHRASQSWKATEPHTQDQCDPHENEVSSFTFAAIFATKTVPLCVALYYSARSWAFSLFVAHNRIAWKEWWNVTNRIGGWSKTSPLQ